MNLFKKYKGIIISLVLGGILGFGGSASGYVPEADYNSVVLKQEKVQSEIASLTTNIEKESMEVEKLKQEKFKKDEEVRLAKEAEEKARIEAEEKAKLEAEEKAKAEIEEKSQSNDNNTSSNNAVKTSSSKSKSQSNSSEKVGQMVWLSATGSKYHIRNNCGNMNPNKATKVTIGQAKARGYGACKKCF